MYMNIKSFFIKRIRKNLIIGISKCAGRNCFGRKTILTQSGGVRLYLNSIDFKRNLSDYFYLIRIEKNVVLHHF